MTKLLMTLVLTSFLFTAAHADEVSDYINTNMLYSDNKELRRVNNTAAFEVLNDRNARMLWSEHTDISQADHDLINSNMLWYDNDDLQAHNSRH